MSQTEPDLWTLEKLWWHETECAGLLLAQAVKLCLLSSCCQVVETICVDKSLAVNLCQINIINLYLRAIYISQGQKRLLVEKCVSGSWVGICAGQLLVRWHYGRMSEQFIVGCSTTQHFWKGAQPVSATSISSETNQNSSYDAQGRASISRLHWRHRDNDLHCPHIEEWYFPVQSSARILQSLLWHFPVLV